MRIEAEMRAEDVEWVVNDLAELGVRINGQCFFLYKGRSLVYEPDDEEEDGVRMVRPVGKREFGECCHPVRMVADGGRIRSYDPNDPKDGLTVGVQIGSDVPPETPIPGGGWEPLFPMT